LKILFMGTSDYAVVCLKALAGSKHEIVSVVSQPDKPKNRGHKLAPTPVHAAADELGLLVHQPTTLKDEAFLPTLEAEKPDLIVVVAYGRILPPYILEFPKFGCINVHGSLLPKYRGAAPIQRAVLNGEKVTGVTTMYMDVGLDTGDMLLKKETAIGEDETSAELVDRLAVLGAQALLETLDLIENGTAVREKQDDALSTYAAMIDKAQAEIDWSKPASEIKNLVRGMNSWPLAYTYYQGSRMKIGSVRVLEGEFSGVPGQILHANRTDGICIRCGEGAVLAETVQFEGKKMMDAKAYLLGNSIEENVILGE